MSKLRYVRATAEIDPESKPGQAIRFVASTSGIKRDGRDLDQSHWMLANYRKNPVVLWSHDWWGFRLPIGRAEANITEQRLVADVLFDQGDEFAREIERKYRSRFLHAVSVGWDDWVQTPDGAMEKVTWRYEPREGDELFYELMDISAVVVPADPDAVMERQVDAYRSEWRELLRQMATFDGQIARLMAANVHSVFDGEDVDGGRPASVQFPGQVPGDVDEAGLDDIYQRLLSIFP